MTSPFHRHVGGALLAFFLSASSLALLTACAGAPSASPAATASATPATAAPPFRRVELFFGRSRRDAPDVSDAEWQSFVDEVMTPAFPDGLTVLDGAGQWRGDDGKAVRERSKIVVLLVPAAKYDAALVERVSLAYRTRFRQESVLRVVGPVDARF